MAALVNRAQNSSDILFSVESGTAKRKQKTNHSLVKRTSHDIRSLLKKAEETSKRKEKATGRGDEVDGTIVID